MARLVPVNAWIISLLVSILYFGLFLYISKVHDPFHNNTPNNGTPTRIQQEPHDNDDNHNDLLFGFCVSGFPQTPDKSHGCHGNYWFNSHTASFAVGLVFTGFVYYLYYRLRKQVEQQQGKDNKDAGMVRLLSPEMTHRFLAVAGVILAHASLHLLLSTFLDCYMPPKDIPPGIVLAGFVFYGLFALFLCVVILGLSFGRVGERQQPQEWSASTTVTTSIVLTGFMVFLTMDTGLEWMLPALFSISHLLSSFAGVFAKSTLFSQTVGWCFLLATVLGILELTQCATFLKPIGGHVWYDICLHTATILVLPPFASLTTTTGSNKEHKR